MQIKKFLSISMIALVGLFSLSMTASAVTTDSLGFNYASAVSLGTKDLRASVMQVINILMGFLGIIAVIIVLTGGFKWMTAMGSEDKIEEARKLIIAGIVGLGIILASYAIAFFVVNSLLNATS